MSQLIGKLRTLINDPAGEGQTFTDDDLQAFLDARRRDVRRDQLTVEPDGDGSYREYYSSYENWEQDAVLEDAGGNELSPASSEWLVGHWSFASSTPPPVFITGKVYDVYGAAADLLEAWAAKVALEYDVAVGDQRLSRSQKAKALLALAEQYKRRMMPTVAVMERGDTELPRGNFVLAK